MKGRESLWEVRVDNEGDEWLDDPAKNLYYTSERRLKDKRTKNVRKPKTVRGAGEKESVRSNQVHFSTKKGGYRHPGS